MSVFHAVLVRMIQYLGSHDDMFNKMTAEDWVMVVNFNADLWEEWNVRRHMQLHVRWRGIGNIKEGDLKQACEPGSLNYKWQCKHCGARLIRFTGELVKHCSIWLVGSSNEHTHTVHTLTHLAQWANARPSATKIKYYSDKTALTTDISLKG